MRGARGNWILQGYYAHPIGDPDHWFFDELRISAVNDNSRCPRG
jgi:hypothetical protein